MEAYTVPYFKAQDLQELPALPRRRQTLMSETTAQAFRLSNAAAVER